MALLTLDGFLFVLRWLHVFFGIIWIGHLYYFNFTQIPFFAETDAPTKSKAIQQLVPRALWWFRWGAMLTWITGFLMLMGYMGLKEYDFGGKLGTIILLGSVIATLMFANVWLVIWPAQKVVIASTKAVAEGKAADPTAAARGARAMVASRTNVLFSMPMLFMMLGGRHFNSLEFNPEQLTLFWSAIAVIFGALQLNALKGKLGPLASVKGVVHMGVLLTIATYLMLEFIL
jgi:uncharacterized membrane protein